MIFNPFASIPVNPKSHVRGWAQHWAECLGTAIAPKDFDLSKANELHLDHGVNFGGSLNLFGGVTDELVDKFEQLLEFKGRLVSLDVPMPNYVEQLTKRKGQSTCSPRLTSAMLLDLADKFAASDTLIQNDLPLRFVSIGDSHSTAFANNQSKVLRTNGLTLHNVISNGFSYTASGSVGLMTLVCGSIDIRHHIGRQTDPEAALVSLCRSYSSLASFMENEFECDVEIAAPVPVEYEGRKIPQTGFYKGSPFTGTFEQRRSWTDKFIDLMSLDHRVIGPPQDWYSMDGEQYAKEHMELSSSVHIAPPSYRRNDWGQK